MKLIEKENVLYIEEIEDFNIQQTLECGQCFHFEKIQEMEYGVVYKEHLLHIKQEDHRLICYGVTAEEWKKIWCSYFDLNRDYHKIKEYLLEKDNRLKEAIEANDGIRILNQDFTETLMSFIISQNKQIPHIKAIVKNVSEKYGRKLGNIGNVEFYSFPDQQQLLKISEDEFRICKAGFRAPYLCDAAQKMVNDEELSIERFADYNYDEAKTQLMKIKGIGEKVANCILLFSLNYRNAFPIDVWIKRIMEKMYFDKETDVKTITKYAEEKFGVYGGYAQQYLFFYAKEQNIKG